MGTYRGRSPAAETLERLRRKWSPRSSPSGGYDGTRGSRIAAAAGRAMARRVCRTSTRRPNCSWRHCSTHAGQLLAEPSRRGPRPLGDGTLPLADRPPAAVMLATLLRRPVSSRRWSWLAATRTSRVRCATTSASGPTGSPSWYAWPRATASWIPRCRPRPGPLLPAAVDGQRAHPPDLHAVDDAEWSALLTRVVGALIPPTPSPHTERSPVVKVRIDSERCHGHGRCYDLAPDLFEEDDEGYGHVVGEEPCHRARNRHTSALANCPERAHPESLRRRGNDR